MALKKLSFSLYQALGVYLPLITTNCAVLGAAILNSDSGYNLLESTLSGCSAALGFTLALLLMAGIRERLALSRMPKFLHNPWRIAFRDFFTVLKRLSTSYPHCCG